LFTGIIEHQGTIAALDIKPSGARLTIHAPSVAPSLAISNSIAVNGCCLTVVALAAESFSADLSLETLRKTSFGARKGASSSASAGLSSPSRSLGHGSRVNLEQPLSAGKEFGGHFVLGHVDTTGRVAHLAPETAESGSWSYAVEVPEDFACYLVPKGSITIDGISLTIANWNPRARIVEIAVIPYTYEHTNIRDRQPGDAVNLEADILGKYVERYLEGRNTAPSSQITMARLLEEGF
jgi:riboflavin synthase